MSDPIKAGELPWLRGVFAVLIFIFFCLLFAPAELVSKYDWLRSFVNGTRQLLHLQ